MELETEEDMAAGGDAKRKTSQNAKKPKVGHGALQSVGRDDYEQMLV